MIRSLCQKMRKISYPASERNKTFILEVLQKYLETNKPGKVLEIASGTGQHVSFFAEHFPNLIFQPSEYDTKLLESIAAYARETPTKNVNNPIKIDITTEPNSWGVPNDFDYMVNVNMIHISPYSCTEGLFKNGITRLKTNGVLVTYGPYAHNGIITPQSNINFDRSLRRENPEWGLRDIRDLETLAKKYGVHLLHIYDLPANNKCLVWQKTN